MTGRLPGGEHPCRKCSHYLTASRFRACHKPGSTAEARSSFAGTDDRLVSFATFSSKVFPAIPCAHLPIASAGWPWSHGRWPSSEPDEGTAVKRPRARMRQESPERAGNSPSTEARKVARNKDNSTSTAGFRKRPPLPKWVVSQWNYAFPSIQPSQNCR